MNDPTLPLSGLSAVSGKTVVAKFDGGLLSSDGGVLLRENEQRCAPHLVNGRGLVSSIEG